MARNAGVWKQPLPPWLSGKKINISEVAYTVGFNDLSWFGKCFRRKYGMSPPDYDQKALHKKIEVN